MATTVDRFLSEFVLVDRYSQKLQAISNKTDSFAGKLAAVEAATIRFAGASLLAVGAGLGIIGIAAVKASADFEQLKVTLEVLTGSATKTADKLEFIRKLALPSTFTFEELAKAGVQLEAFRVPLEKALPSIAKLGAAFPTKQIGDFVQIFGRLASGDFPDLEALSGAGLSKLDFMNKGIKFDGQGSLLSSSRETMNALDAIVTERYGNILEKMANTTNAKLATLRDKWEVTLRRIGDAIVKFVIPALDRLSAALESLDKNGGFDKFLKNMAKNVTLFVGLILGALTVFLTAMAIIQAALGNFVVAAVLGVAAIATALATPVILKRLGNFLKGLESSKPGAPDAVPTAPAGLEFPDSPSAKLQNSIEKNTKETADNTRKALDLRKFALGGGELGALGITPIERFGRGQGQGRQNSVNVNVQGKDALSRAIQEIVQQVMHQNQTFFVGGR